MPYVIVTPHRTYARSHSREESALSITDRWAERLDELDGQITRPTDRSYGGRIRQVEIPPISSTERHGGSGPARFFALQRVKRAYETAAFLANEGHVGIAVGHGLATSAQAWVDLAPVGLCRVDIGLVEQVWRLRQAGDSPPRPLSAEEQLVEDMGAIFRKRRRVRRVDLYACSVGGGEAGQRLLDWLHYLWGIPVRGLRGELEFSGNVLNPSQIPEVRVLPPPGVANPWRGFGRPIRDQLIRDPRYWASSHRRRPDLTTPAPSGATPPPPGVTP